MSYYSLAARPLSLPEAAKEIGIGISTLKKRRNLLQIKGQRGPAKHLFLAPEDVVILQYAEQHQYVYIQIEAGAPLTEIRTKILSEVGAQQSTPQPTAHK